MTTSTTDQDLLDGWLQGKQRRGERRHSQDPHVQLGSRFAFYGRMSTSEYQDRRSSRLWQREVCERLVAGHGVVVAEFFDEGASRRRRWSNRPEAARLLEALADPDRGFDAIVVGSTSGRSAVVSSMSWCRCCVRPGCRCGCRRSAAGWTWMTTNTVG